MTNVADILGPDAASSDVYAIRGVASQLEDISTTATSIKGNLSALDAASWEGAAATAYREKQNNDIPGELAKLVDSFGSASRALSAYAGNLDWILSQAQALARQFDAATETHASALNTEASATRDLEYARAARAAASDPLAIAHADAVVNRAARRYSTAVTNREATQESISRLEGQAQSLREALQNDVGQCVGQLVQASDAGITNSLFSWGDRYIVDGIPGELVADGVHVLDHLAKDWSEFVDHYGKILDLVALALAVAAVAALAVVAGPETLVLAPAILGYASKFGTVLDATKAGADTWLALRGDGSWSTVGNDRIQVGIDLLPLPKGLSGERQADQAIGKYFSSLDKYAETGTKQALGWVTKRVNALVAPVVKNVIIEGTWNLINTVGDDPAIKFVEQHVKSLLGPPVLPGPVPLIGPFPGLMQGPNATVRATIAASIPVRAAA